MHDKGSDFKSSWHLIERHNFGVPKDHQFLYIRAIQSTKCVGKCVTVNNTKQCFFLGLMRPDSTIVA